MTEEHRNMLLAVVLSVTIQVADAGNSPVRDGAGVEPVRCEGVTVGTHQPDDDAAVGVTPYEIRSAVAIHITSPCDEPLLRNVRAAIGVVDEV